MESSDSQPETVRQPSQFATTRWSIVLSAGRKSSEDAGRALAVLCETYWHPLYAYIRRQVPDVHQAQDLTQAFFAEVLEKDYFAAAVPERGRFRSFLLTSCKHFLSKQREKARAQKRGGGRAPLSLDFHAADSSLGLEPAAGLTAEQLYDRQWAITLLARVLQRLEAEQREKGRGEQFAILKGHLIGEHAGTTYAEAAARMNVSQAAAKKAASRLRQRYRELLRDEIAQTVGDPADVEEEIRSLFANLVQ